MTGTHISMLTMIKIDISDNPFIKDDIFEATVFFSPRGTPVVMVFHYCENHNMSYFLPVKKIYPMEQSIFWKKNNQCMDSKYWKKRAKKSATSNGSFLYSTYHGYMQKDTRYHSMKIQEYLYNKYSRNIITLFSPRLIKHINPLL